MILKIATKIFHGTGGKKWCADSWELLDIGDNAHFEIVKLRPREDYGIGIIEEEEQKRVYQGYDHFFLDKGCPNGHGAHTICSECPTIQKESLYECCIVDYVTARGDSSRVIFNTEAFVLNDMGKTIEHFKF